MPSQEFGRRSSERGNLVAMTISRCSRQIAGIVICAAVIVFALGAVYVVGMKAVGRALSNHWEENAGYPTLDEPVPSRAKPASTYNELRTSCQHSAKNIQLSRAMDNELSYSMNIRVGELQLEQHAFFIDCLMTTLPSRLCLVEHRAHLVDAVRAYFRLLMRVREEWAMMRANPFSLHAVKGVRPPGPKITTQFPSERTDPRIIYGLTTLINEGYLTRADLNGGGFLARMPGDLSSQLEGVEGKRRRCG
jgi:hypothetical protein